MLSITLQLFVLYLPSTFCYSHVCRERLLLFHQPPAHQHCLNGHVTKPARTTLVFIVLVIYKQIFFIYFYFLHLNSLNCKTRLYSDNHLMVQYQLSGTPF